MTAQGLMQKARESALSSLVHGQRRSSAEESNSPLTLLISNRNSFGSKQQRAPEQIKAATRHSG
ncbi:Uncharacterized protein DAT39_015416 [Clarias magur]|uniref:Uncharacterized protein n=1 Tax=Clarias magur TaxID=1594786 RepID=A0A8J4UBF1_CLAMG|nr:Uncharacterized protein DAT39_015416 [Clarias magur]